jgi:hypothetical protein
MVALPDLGGSDGVNGADVSVETCVNSISGFGIFVEQASGWELHEMSTFNLALHKSSDCNPFDLFHLVRVQAVLCDKRPAGSDSLKLAPPTDLGPGFDSL